MNFTEKFHQLSKDDQAQLLDALRPYDMDIESIENLLSLRIVLEGKIFDATIPSDFAHSLWKLQLAYYRMIGAVLHNSPSAVLSSEEKEQHKLVFKISKGSTNGTADIWSSSLNIAEKAFDKMEPWQVLLAVALIAGAYVGGKLFNHLSENARIQAEKEKALAQIQTEKEKALAQNETVQKMFDAHKEIFNAAFSAGQEGRIAVIKGVAGIERAQIGEREYDAEKIEQIKRRSAWVKAVSNTCQMLVTVEKIDTQDKSDPVVYLRERGADNSFKASLAIEGEDEEDLQTALDIIWDAARYPDRFFWVEISISSKKGKVVSASITALAHKKEDLPDNTEEITEL